MREERKRDREEIRSLEGKVRQLESKDSRVETTTQQLQSTDQKLKETTLELQQTNLQVQTLQTKVDAPIASSQFGDAVQQYLGSHSFTVTGAAGGDFIYDQQSGALDDLHHASQNSFLFDWEPMILYRPADWILFEGVLSTAFGSTGTGVDLSTADFQIFLNNYMTVVAGLFDQPFGDWYENQSPMWVNRFVTAPLPFGVEPVVPPGRAWSPAPRRHAIRRARSGSRLHGLGRQRTELHLASPWRRSHKSYGGRKQPDQRQVVRRALSNLSAAGRYGVGAARARRVHLQRQVEERKLVQFVGRGFQLLHRQLADPRRMAAIVPPDAHGTGRRQSPGMVRAGGLLPDRP